MSTGIEGDVDELTISGSGSAASAFKHFAVEKEALAAIRHCTAGRAARETAVTACLESIVLFPLSGSSAVAVNYSTEEIVLLLRVCCA